MRILLDTHFLQWIIVDPNELSVRERVTIADPDNHILVSPVSIWEIRIKWEKFDSAGRRRGLLDPSRALHYIARIDFELAILTAEDCAATLAVPTEHGDPFDQMLLVHAQRLDARLMTRDRRLRGHPLTVQL